MRWNRSVPHQSMRSSSYYSQASIHRWWCRISSVNSGNPRAPVLRWFIFSLYIFVSLDITSLLCKGDVLAGKELFAECWSYSTCHGWNSCFHGHRWCGQHHSWGRRVAGASHNGRGLFSAGPSWAQEGWNSGSLTFLCTSTYLTRIWTLLSSHMGWERSITSERGTV